MLTCFCNVYPLFDSYLPYNHAHPYKIQQQKNISYHKKTKPTLEKLRGQTNKMKYLKTIYKNPKNLMVEQTHQQAVRPEKKIKGKILKGKKKSNSFKKGFI